MATADETYPATTTTDGVATATVTPTRPVGTASYTVTWSDGVVTVTDTADVAIGDVSAVVLDPGNPTTGQATDTVTLGATLTDSDGTGIPDVTVTFTVGGATATGTTDSTGHATATPVLTGPAGDQNVTAAFAGGAGYGQSEDTGTLTVTREDTVLTLTTEPAPKNGVVLLAILTEDGGPIAGRTVTFTTPQTVKGQEVTQVMGTAITDSAGQARLPVATKYLSNTVRPVTATFNQDTTFLGSTGTTTVSR